MPPGCSHDGSTKTAREKRATIKEKPELRINLLPDEFSIIQGSAEMQAAGN